MKTVKFQEEQEESSGFWWIHVAIYMIKILTHGHLYAFA